MKNYYGYMLLNIREIDFKQGVKKYNGIRQQYYKELNNFLIEIPVFLKELNWNEIKQNINKGVHSLELLKGAFVKIASDILEEECDLLISTIKSNDCDKGVVLFNNLIDHTNQLILSLNHCVMHESTESKENVVPIKELKTHSTIKSNLKFDDVEALRLRVYNYEFQEAIDLVYKLTTFTYGPKIDGTLRYIYEMLKLLLEDSMDSSTAEVIALLDTLGVSNNVENDTQKLKILAVDDLAGVLTTIKGVLKDQYNVFGAISYEAAMKYLNNQVPDLILLDIEMPGMDGFKLMEHIRAMPKHKHTPIIFLTGNATKEYLTKAIEMGVNDFIRKPIETEILLEKIGRQIKKHAKL